jgi:hypothetical protein
VAHSQLILTKTYANSDERERVRSIHWVQVNNRWILFTDGVSGIYEWDSTVNAPTQVKDYVPYLDDNNGGSGITAAECPYAPIATYMVEHRGRIFLANPWNSKVYYSGVRTDLDIVVNAVERPLRPWELWNVSMDMSRTNPGYGGSMLIGDRKYNTTGLASTEAGLLVFKEREILLWEYPDTAAPHEVENGASITTIIEGIGGVSHESISVDGNVIYFLGQNTWKDFGLYRLVGGEITELSYNIPQTMHSMSTMDLTENPPFTVIHDGYVYVGVDAGIIDSDGDHHSSIVLAFDIANGCFVEMTSPPVTCADILPSLGSVLMPSDYGRIYQFPSDVYVDEYPDGDEEIEFALHTKSIDADTMMHDKKFRGLWYHIETMTGDQTDFQGELDISVAMEYSDAQGQYRSDESETHTVTGSQGHHLYLHRRALRGMAKFYGTYAQKFRIKMVAIGWRPRKDRVFHA